MEINDEIVENTTLIHLKGKLDSSVAQEFYAEMISLVNSKNRHYLFEMSGVELVDSMGLGTLVRIYKRIIESDGALRLANLPPFILEIFQFTDLDSVFQICETTEEALKSLKNT